MEELKGGFDVIDIIKVAAAIASGGPNYWIAAIVALLGGFAFLFKYKSILLKKTREESDQKWNEEKAKNESAANEIQEEWEKAEEGTIPPPSDLPRRPR